MIRRIIAAGAGLLAPLAGALGLRAADAPDPAHVERRVARVGSSTRVDAIARLAAREHMPSVLVPRSLGRGRLVHESCRIVDAEHGPRRVVTGGTFRRAAR
jgi:hypothetical protein